MLYFVPMNFVLKQPSNIAQMRAQNESAYDGYILCYMQKKETRNKMAVGMADGIDQYFGR